MSDAPHTPAPTDDSPLSFELLATDGRARRAGA